MDEFLSNFISTVVSILIFSNIIIRIVKKFSSKNNTDATKVEPIKTSNAKPKSLFEKFVEYVDEENKKYSVDNEILEKPTDTNTSLETMQADALKQSSYAEPNLNSFGISSKSLEGSDIGSINYEGLSTNYKSLEFLDFEEPEYIVYSQQEHTNANILPNFTKEELVKAFVASQIFGKPKAIGR